MPADDYTPEQRQEDQRIAAASRLAEATRKIAAEDSAQFWDRLGFNVRTDAGLDRLRRVVNGADILGIDLSSREGTEEFRNTIAFARDLRRKTIEAGSETRKGLVHGIAGAIIASILGALGAFFSIKGGGPH